MLDTVTHLTADDLADDIETNLAIEALVAGRREQKEDAEESPRGLLKTA